MSDIEYEPAPEGALQEPQLQVVQRWNVRALVSFLIPIFVFALGLLVGVWFEALLPSNSADPLAQLGASLTLLIIGTVLEIAAQVVGVVLGHQSLRPGYRQLRGRGFGIAGLILNYAGLLWAVIGVIGSIAVVVGLGVFGAALGGA